MAAGIRPDDAAAGALVERHREALSAFYPVSRQMHVHLGRMYVADDRFTAHYDRERPGLAAWLRDAIEASARTHGIEPDTAEWA